MENVKIKSVSSTGTVDFRNTSKSYYDMIIMIQNSVVNQTITIKDTQGNEITEQPINIVKSAKIILKDIKIGSITFADSNTYSVVISYSVKLESSGIPYIDIDYQTGYQTTSQYSVPIVLNTSFPVNAYLSIGPPKGQAWKIKYITMSWTAGATATVYPVARIYSSGETVVSSGLTYQRDGNTDNIPLNNIIYIYELSETSGDIYIVSLEYL
jgi:hypothetical protein